MIISSVKIQKLLIRKFWNHLGISTRFHSIRRIWKQGIKHFPVVHFIWRRESSFHLIVDNTIQCERTVYILHLVMPALLLENLLFLINIRIKNRIQIDMHQILKILVITACNRIDSLVTVCHSVQKCVERPLYKLYKRVLDWKILGTAKYSVLYNMWYTCGIRRRRAKANIKYFIFLLILQQCYPCTCLFVPQKPTHSTNIVNLSVLNHFVSCQIFNFFHFIIILSISICSVLTMQVLR